MTKTTMTSLADRIPDETAAYLFLEEFRWHGSPVCPHCGSEDEHYYLHPRGEGRKTRTGEITPRRVWKCRDCRKQFSATTGTVMHGSKVSLRIWLFVIFEMCANKNGIAAREIERRFGVASRTAWHMTHRIREAMSGTEKSLFKGDVVADETYIGGDPENWHADKRPKTRTQYTHKTPVVSLIDAATGEVRSKVVPWVDGASLRAVISENVDLGTTTLHTDSSPRYWPVARKMAGHHMVNHHIGQYVSEKSRGTQMAENFFSQLKRSIDGTHHHVSVEHLHCYLNEFDFRYSTCRESDTVRFGLLLSLLGGRRLTYKRVVG
jgi:transposase-like protein